MSGANRLRELMARQMNLPSSMMSPHRPARMIRLRSCFFGAKNPLSVQLLRRDNSEILISVEDQGMGIAKKHLPRLFERFYGVDKARSRTMGGTGLELAIVKHIARAHGGDVTVASTRGQGSTFIIHLPIQTKGFGSPIWTCCRHGHRCR